MPTWVQVLLAAAVLAIAYGGFAVLIGRLCGLNDNGGMRAVGRASERVLTLGADRRLDAEREGHYEQMDAMARARARGDSNVVELRPRPASARGGWAA